MSAAIRLLMALSRAARRATASAWADLAGGRFLVNEVDGEDAPGGRTRARSSRPNCWCPTKKRWPDFLRQRIGLRRRAPWHVR